MLGKPKYPVLYAQECWFVFYHLLAGSWGHPSCSLTVCSMSHSECIYYFIITSVSLDAPRPQCETKPFLLFLHPFWTLKMSIFKAIPRMSSPLQGTSPKQLFFPKHTGASDNWPYFLNYMCEDQMGLCLRSQVNLQCLVLEFLWTVFHRCPFLSFGLPGLSAFLGGSFLSNVGRIIS